MRLERENFHVLSMQGKVVEAKPQALHKKKEVRNTVALDSEQNTIQKRDIVNVIDGPHSVSLCLSNNKYLIFKVFHVTLFDYDDYKIIRSLTKTNSNSYNVISQEFGFRNF